METRAVLDERMADPAPKKKAPAVSIDAAPASPPAGARPSLRDIARELGLSHVAVSLALRDSPRVSEARRAEVKAVAEKLGYRPDPMLASLVAYRQGKRPAGIRACLGWINQWAKPEELRGFKEFDLYWNGAREAAERLGYNLEEFRWPAGKSGRRLQTILETRGVRGLLLPPHRNGLDLLDFDWSRFSLVRFGASVTNLPAHSVTSDQAHCARLAYEKALELGRKRVGYASDVKFEKTPAGTSARATSTPRKSSRRARGGWTRWSSPPSRAATRRNWRSGCARKSRTRS